jgi:hypothetical protein
VHGLTLPIQAYKPTAAEQNLVTDAEEKLISQCMSEFGFTWKYVPSNVSNYNEVTREYGVTDLATVRQYGYQLPPAEAGGQSAGNSATPAASGPLSPSELLVLSGSTTGSTPGNAPAVYRGRQVPHGGCAGQARARVTGVDEIDPTDLVDTIGLGMWQESQSDPRVLKAFGDWSACMRQAGYSFPTPLAAAARWAGKAVSQAQIDTAVTDVRCKQRTNLIGIWFTVESGYENEAIRRNIKSLTEIRSLWAAAARKAARVLGVAATQ